VRAGVEEPPWSPFADAVGSLVVGSERFVAKMRGLLRERVDDEALPQLAPLKPRPPLEQIAASAATRFGHDTTLWQPGRRVDNASRAVAAYVARRHFGYSAKDVTVAMRYRGHGGVHSAVARVESSTAKLRKTAEELAQAFR